MADDYFQVENLVCTNCNHDLNHPAYDIRIHPEFPAPLCILCYDAIEQALLDNADEKDADGSDNYCCWCADDDGTLFCCDVCPLSYCKDCLVGKLGAAAFDHVEQSENWKCLGCDDTQLQKFVVALESGYSQSMYHSAEVDEIQGIVTIVTVCEFIVYNRDCSNLYHHLYTR